MRQFLLGLGRRLGAFSDRMFGRHLLLTNAAISTAMGFTGDGVQQYYEVACGFQDNLQSKRSTHMAAAGLTTGIVTHYWYNLLDRWWQGRAAKIVLKKVLYDQVLFSPVCLTVYFGTLAVLERSSLTHFKEELADKGGTVYMVEWMVWPLAQALNFYYLPLRYRVAFDTVISFGFDVFTPYIKYRDQRQLDGKCSLDGTASETTSGQLLAESHSKLTLPDESTMKAHVFTQMPTNGTDKSTFRVH